MLYLNEKVKIPKKSTYAQPVGKYTYLYLVLGSYYNDKHQQRHRQKSLGRIVKDEDGKEWLIPNDNYYEIYNLPKPKAGEVKKSGPGRQNGPRKLESHQEPSASGYAAAVKKIAEALGLYGILKDLLGSSKAERVLAIAAYYAQSGGRADLTEFSYFMEDCMAPLFKPFDGRGVLYAFENDGGYFLEEFLKRWNALQDKNEGTPVLLEAISYSNTGGAVPADMLDYEAAPDDLEKTHLAVICSPSNHRPLCLCEYLDAINDGFSLKNVGQVCKNAGISAKFDVVYDCWDDQDLPGGGLDFSAFRGRGILTPVSYKKNPTVRTAILENQGALQQGSAEHLIEDGGSVLFAASIPFALGKTEGTLMMILNPALKARYTPRLVQKQARLRSELEAARRYPADPSRYDGFFKITKDESAKGFAFADDVKGFGEQLSLCGFLALYTTRQGLEVKQALCDLKARTCTVA